MAYMIEQIHVRIGQDKEVIKAIHELLDMCPDRWESQSELIRAAIMMLHRQIKEERQWMNQLQTTTTQTK